MVDTVLGPVRLHARLVSLRGLRHGFAPRDPQLGVGGGSLSPGLAEMIDLAGAEVSFARAARLLEGLAGVTLTARRVERSAEASGAARPARPPRPRPPASARRKVVPLPPAAGPGQAVRAMIDGTGVPVPRKRDRRPGGQGRGRPRPDPRGQARRALHRTSLDDDGNPVRDPDSSSYIATFDRRPPSPTS